jgi:hypothetical protein
MRYQVIFAVNFALLLAAVAAQLNIPSEQQCVTDSLVLPSLTFFPARQAAP